MKLLIFWCLCLFVSRTHAYEGRVYKGELAPELTTLLEKASSDTGTPFDPSDFILIENRTLATSHFTMYVQANSMVPVARTAVRIWKDLVTNELILAEMHLDEKVQRKKETLINRYMQAKFSPQAMKSKQLADAVSELVHTAVKEHDADAKILGLKFKDQWQKGDLVRVVEARGRRGLYHITISLLKNQIVESEYREFHKADSFSLKAHVFPVYEEVEGTGERLPFELREIKYLDMAVPEGGENPLGSLKEEMFPETQYSVLLAGTPLGDQLGLWSEFSIRSKVEKHVRDLPVRMNNLASGVLLQGKYATINLHPDVKAVYRGQLELNPSVHHLLKWSYEDSGYGARAVSGLQGKLIYGQEELLTRIPFRHPEHDAARYIESGFDEIQVYYGVTALMESLVQMGFTDPELSEKPFHAFLFDPDIGMKDNAYYYDNTINFTTYNPGTPNLARDNPTIWHELGHAIMERLMGVHLVFESQGGYGGLSEGMADFLAQIVLEDQTKGLPFPGKENFRIMNQIGFDLTNEFHDEGEAYGGAMNDMLTSAISHQGGRGLEAFTDLTLETMRLTRNHPGLSARSWFEHMLYADELGSAMRAPRQYRELIESSLAARNFSFDESFNPAQMKVEFKGGELTSTSVGSRNRPLSECGKDGVIANELRLTLKSGDSEFITFPAIVKVEYKKGALQGSINWLGEENNPQIYTIRTEEEVMSIPLAAKLECEFANLPDGSCKDYAYLQVYNEGSSKPVAKKRFYLELNKENCQ